MEKIYEHICNLTYLFNSPLAPDESQQYNGDEDSHADFGCTKELARHKMEVPWKDHINKGIRGRVQNYSKLSGSPSMSVVCDASNGLNPDRQLEEHH